MEEGEAHLLRVYVDIAARREGKPYAQVLLDRARAMGVANAAVLEVLDAYGRESLVHGGKATDLEPGRRLIVELVDRRAALDAFHATLEPTDDASLVTLETVAVVGYGGHRHHSG